MKSRESISVETFLRKSIETLEVLDQDVIEAIVDRLFLAWREQRTVFVMGNGGSASTASHFAADLSKYTICDGKPRFRVLGLTDNVPLVSAWTNDNGFDSIFAEQLVAWMQPRDVLVGFSVHGGAGGAEAGPWSQNMVRAMHDARSAGLAIVGFSGYDGGSVATIADHCVVVPALVDDLGTPIVESVHVLLHHLVVHALRGRIRDA